MECQKIINLLDGALNQITKCKVEIEISYIAKDEGWDTSN